MSKENQNTENREQALKSCVHNLHEIESTIKNLFPVLKTQVPLGSFATDELRAYECLDKFMDAFAALGDLIVFEIRKEVTNG